MTKKNIIIASVAAVVILIAIVIVAFNSGRNKGEEQAINKINETNTAAPDDIPGAVVPEKELSPEEAALVEMIKESKVEVPGGSLVTKDGKVITPTGEQTKTDVQMYEDTAPRAARDIEKTDLPESAIQINASLGKFDPSIFKVRAGGAITISLSSTDGKSHIFAFRDKSLNAVRIATPLGGGTTAMTFQAPSVRGEYEFYCAVGGSSVGHESRGEVGKMIVE